MSHVYKQVTRLREQPRYSPVEAVKNYGDIWRHFAFRNLPLGESVSITLSSVTFDQREAAAMSMMEQGQLPRVEV